MHNKGVKLLRYDTILVLIKNYNDDNNEVILMIDSIEVYREVKQHRGQTTKEKEGSAKRNESQSDRIYEDDTTLRLKQRTPH